MTGRARAVLIGEPDGSAPLTFDQLYEQQWMPMLRLATGLVDYVSAAEDVVQDAFTAVYRHWSGIRDPQAAVAYLRRSVVNGSRSALRRRAVARKHDYDSSGETVEGADHRALLSAEHDLVNQAMSRLPDRQREVLTLRYVAQVSDTEIAAATGLSVVGVRSASSRGLAALRIALGGQL